MNSAQRWLIIFSIVGVGFVLAFVFLGVGTQYDIRFFNDGMPIFIISYDGVSHYGLYAAKGVAGVIFGLIIPLCLFAFAAFIALGAARRS